MQVNFHSPGTIDLQHLEYAVIAAVMDDRNVFVRHRERQTWEIPGGRREPDETIDETARRELREETGASVFTMKAVCDYSVTHQDRTTYGRLFFSTIARLEPLPQSEIAEVKLFEGLPPSWTYPLIQPLLLEKIYHLKKGNHHLA
jgi:8-oxo-dGTP diphosphatase